MEGQYSLYDYLKPDYKGSKDEIVRFHKERQLESLIILQKCECGNKPNEYFRSCHEYFIMCPSCRKRTKYFRHLYESKQHWNLGERISEGKTDARYTGEMSDL